LLLVTRKPGGAIKEQSMQMLKIGDMAVYPAQGVAQVTGIESKELMGKKVTFYILRIVDTDMKIMVPVDRSDAVGLRQVIDEDEIATLYKLLKQRNIKVDRQPWNRRYRGFMEKLKTGKIHDVAVVYRDLSLLKHDKVLSFGERRMLDTAKNLIVKELSVAKHTNEKMIELELENLFVSKDIKTKPD
jgi:CarD family transcriptional regulator